MLIPVTRHNRLLVAVIAIRDAMAASLRARVSSTVRYWTVSDLKGAVQQWYGVTYQDNDSYQQLFHRCGLSDQRAERVYRSRPSPADMAAFEAELEKK